MVLGTVSEQGGECLVALYTVLWAPTHIITLCTQRLYFCMTCGFYILFLYLEFECIHNQKSCIVIVQCYVPDKR